jgi:hypothetical protein
MYNHNMFLVIGMILTAVALTDSNTPISYAEKRECKDLTRRSNTILKLMMTIKNQKKLSRNL